MTKFFVGQRVRIVRLRVHTHLNGKECRIASMGHRWYDSSTGESYGFCIELDFSVNGLAALVDEEVIEPILPEDHQPADMTIEELLPFLKVREAA